MGTRDPRIDAYIAKQKDVAKPILTHLRGVVHAACPDVDETLKWSAPFFVYRGGVMCSMAAFEKFPPLHRREYVDWIVEAKREATKARRVAQAVEWIAKGRSRNSAHNLDVC